MINTDVVPVCMRSAKITDIDGELKEIKRTCTDKYDHVIIVCGGNNCAVADPKLDAIVESYKDLIITAKSTAHKVTVSSVPPRLKPQHVPEAISSLNAALQAMAADNHDVFHLQNGDINDGYLYNDRIHLSLRGADALVKSIGIKLKHGYETATSARPKQSTATTWGTKTVQSGSQRGPSPSHNHIHWGQPREATVVKMAPTRPLASRSFCLLAPLCDHRSLSNLQQRNTEAWYTL